MKPQFHDYLLPLRVLRHKKSRKNNNYFRDNRFELGTTWRVTISAKVLGRILSILPVGELLQNNNHQWPQFAGCQYYSWEGQFHCTASANRTVITCSWVHNTDHSEKYAYILTHFEWPHYSSTITLTKSSPPFALSEQNSFLLSKKITA